MITLMIIWLGGSTILKGRIICLNDNINIIICLDDNVDIIIWLEDNILYRFSVKIQLDDNSDVIIKSDYTILPLIQCYSSVWMITMMLSSGWITNLDENIVFCF